MSRFFVFLISFLLFGVASASDSNNDSFAVSSAGGFQIGTAAVGGGCILGDVGVDASGLMVSCESGIWSQAAAGVPSGTICGLYTVSSNPRLLPNTNLSCDGVSVKNRCPYGFNKVVRVERETGYSDSITLSTYWCVKS